MKILVADDDRVSRRLMERTLERSGYEVTTVGDGIEAALELSKPDGPRLALIDWMMPQLDGLGVCHEVRSRSDGPYVYIVLLTAKELSEDIVMGLEAGADDYLTKPCQPAELMARLHTGRRVLQLEDKLVDAREAMRFKATHDSLTALWDRGAILSLLNKTLKQAAQQNFCVSILLCDIDHFKKINDSYGHLIGDEVLREVSTRLLGAVRSFDAVGRYGGEEFLVILTGCSREHLSILAEQVRSAIGSDTFSTTHGPIPVTLSVGAVTVEGWSEFAPIEPWLKEVDAALYHAKEAGRNQVIFADTCLAA